jgi:hypothetical protein
MKEERRINGMKNVYLWILAQWPHVISIGLGCLMGSHYFTK